MQRLLVSVRGPTEALAAARGGCQIADVEYPASALGTPYPLNIGAVRARLKGAGFGDVRISTNVGETPYDRANACQAALGVATAGADYIKFGLGELPLEAAAYQGKSIVRTVRQYYPRASLLPAVFVDKDLQRFFKPLEESPDLVQQIESDGVLIDTFEKSRGMGLLDYCTVADIEKLVLELHKLKRQVWIAGSITYEEMGDLWRTGVDVICVRSAACKPTKGHGRFGDVDRDIVARLVASIPD